MNLSSYRDHNDNSLAGTIEHLTERIQGHGLTFILILVDKETEGIHVSSNVEQSQIPVAMVRLASELNSQLTKRDPLHVSGETV